jgi:hypothetical protein
MSIPDTVRHQSREIIFETYVETAFQLPADRHASRHRRQQFEALAGAE